MAAQLIFSGYFSCCSFDTILEQQGKEIIFSQVNQLYKYSVRDVQDKIYFVQLFPQLLQDIFKKNFKEEYCLVV